MIDIATAISNAQEYLSKRKRKFSQILVDKIEFISDELLVHGKFEDQKKSVWVIPYEVEMFDIPDVYFIEMDAATGKVLYTVGPHGYPEDREQEGFE
ncbi:MAG: hypothetical protein NXI10_00855 [bacterium]|nr:hypothetical protein [bacterium]